MSQRWNNALGPYETVRWSSRYGGCLLFGYVDQPNYDSSDEGYYPTKDSARKALSFYENCGLMVLGSCA